MSRWYAHKPKGADLRIPDEILDSVAFLTIKDDAADKSKPAGTAVLLTQASRVPGEVFTYLATAGHCVVGMKRHRHSYVRANTWAGGLQEIEVDPNEWRMAEDYPATDLAVMPFSPGPLRIVGCSL